MPSTNSKSVDFIGIGAQRCGTSWIYACLYEHPDIYAPLKEIHFFSRLRYEKGIEWYLGHFSQCPDDVLCGEYSTSYLYSTEAAKRIHEHFPHTKIIVSLRNPIERAFSQYQNEIKTGGIEKSMTFPEFIREDKSALEQGFYTDQLRRYFDLFGRDNVHVLIYEDSKHDPKEFIQSIYKFLGIRADFEPSMLHREVNTSRTPKRVGFEKAMIRTSQFLRKAGLDKLVWQVKKSGIPDKLRSANTETEDRKMHPETKRKLVTNFYGDVQKLSKLLSRDLISLWIR